MGEHLKNNNGLTLIEVIVTIGILGIIITPVLTMFITTARTNKFSEMKMDATIIAQRVMENIKTSSDLDNIDLNPNFNGYDVEITINETEYKFLDSESEQTPTDKINYDIKVVLDEDDNIASYYNFNDTDMLLFSSANPDIEFIYNNNNIQINHGANNTNVNVGSTGEIIFELFGDEDIFVSGKNDETNKTLTMYFMKSPNSDSDYSFHNQGGSIKVFNNIILNNNQDLNNSRVYMIGIKVKDKDGKIIEETSGYKTFLQ